MAGPNYTHTQLEQLWELAGGPVQYADTAAAIAEAESGGCQYDQRGPRDIRPTRSCRYVYDPRNYVIGLWQINQSAHPQYARQSLFDALKNAEAAVAISRNGTDFNPWTTYTSGAYATHLVGSEASAKAAATSKISALHGYSDLNKTLSHHLTKNVHQATLYRKSARRTLSRLHKR